MSHNQLDFVIPENQSISELVSLLQNNFTVRVLAEAVNHRVFYDTFDWRLYKNGSVLEKYEDGQFSKIYWRAGKHGKLKIQLGLRKVPRLASELAAGEFRQQLQSVISVRELTPRIKIKIKRLPLVVLDKKEKVVVRLNFDEYWYSPSRLRAGRVLSKRLTIKSVKGYLKNYQQVEVFFLAMKLHPAQNNLMKLALLVKGVSPGEYTTKLNLMLDPDMSAEQALKKILLRLLEILRQNTTGSINGKDTEFMHDYRVSIRKTRTALKQINDVLPHEVSEKYKKFFSILGKLTTPVRDLDVFLLQLESYQRDFSKSEKQQLQALREYLLLSRVDSQKEYVEVLKSSRYRENIKQWRDYLEHSWTESFPPDKPSKAIYKLADELLWDIYQQAIEQGNAIVNNSKAEALHELRKTFKKLRYVMEFFRSIYPAGKMRVLIQTLKTLQDSLGEFNDLDVHVGIVKGFIKQSVNEDAIKVCEQMIINFEQQQHKIRARFADSYADFSSSDNQNQFQQMFVDYHRVR
ncbi:MAG: CHAD domain-containing protein [Gammaproteobacteria bacterium]|nr:CHAD domain-containing protein [Gammaproteobacteria bacterium]